MSEKLKKYLVSKKNWKAFLFSFLLIISLAFVSQVFAQDFGIDQVGDGLGGSLGDEASDPRVLAGKIINFSLGFLGLLALGLILFAGFKWMTSGGEQEKISKAKGILISASIGLIIILSSWTLATFLLNKFGGVITGSDYVGGYNNGDIRSCGCDGYMVYNNGAWGFCIGGECGGLNGPKTCDLDTENPVCQPLDQICAEGYYCDDSCYCQEKGSMGDSCNLNEDTDVCRAGDGLCGSYLKCDPDSCLCVGSPVITGISPLGGFCENNQDVSCQDNFDCNGGVCDLVTPNGAAGNFLSIFGKNFGTYVSGQTKVVFVGINGEREALNPSQLNPSCADSWRDDQIVVAVPQGVSSGPLKVIIGDLSDATNDEKGPVIPDFKVNSINRPGLCSINPDRGLLSSTVGYHGFNLYASSAYFGNYSTNVAGLSSDFNDATGLSGEAKTPNIKAGESGSFVVNSINGREERSNYMSFVKEREEGEGAFISSFSPARGNAGQYVSIFGSGFGGARGSSQVFFGDNVEAVYDFPEVCLGSVWSNNQIIVKVPSGLTDGDFTITIKLGKKVIDTKTINPNVFSFNKNLDLKTSICKIDPTRGPAQTPVKIWGEYFGKKGTEGVVQFNGDQKISAPISEESRANTLEVDVPLDAITGPVRVLKNGDYGNELNFLVSECSVNSDCGSDFCCPADTYKKGQCVKSREQCYVDVPNSVFEWSFQTGYGSKLPAEVDSCAGLSEFYGACHTDSCPNVPGTCSPYPGNKNIYSAPCSQDCSKVAGCGTDCYYDSNSDRCLHNKNCDLNKIVEVNILGKATRINSYCNKNNNWEIDVSSSCPDGYVKGDNNKCFILGSDCSICGQGLTCFEISGEGRCVSSKICPSSSSCDAASNRCVSKDDPSCDCCCTINQSSRDCCTYVAKGGQVVQLECGGTCGSDTDANDDSGFGRCGGCKSAGDTVSERDLACNCTGHSGQYCEIYEDEFPDGYCTDCSSLSRDSCLEHSDVCCLDSKGTVDPNDDVCRGGKGDEISNDPKNPDFGYCSYYNCSEDEPNICASSDPVKLGSFSKIAECEKSCSQSNPCEGITDLNECLAEPSGRCCFDFKDGEGKCSLGKKIQGDSEDAGYCAYYNCSDNNTCNYKNPFKDGTYKSIEKCDKFCANSPEGMGISCTDKRMNDCDISVCNADGFSCLNKDGNLFTEGDCGACCCQPVTSVNGSDSCQDINLNLSCVADKGVCSGSERGLCCGCSKDSDCGSDESIACGADTCCYARPKIESTSPNHLESDVCRNAIIKVKFDKVMDHNTLRDNFILIEEKDSGGLCEAGRMISQVELGSDFINSRKTGFLASLKNKINHSWQLVASSFSKSYAQRVLAQVPSPNKLYCSVAGNVFLENTNDSSVLNFIPDTLLQPSTNYYVLVKGDKDLNSQSGVLSLNKTGFNGKGYLNSTVNESQEYVEGENITFNGQSFKNSAIIKFSTLSTQSSKTGICDIDRVELDPYSYLIKTTDNALSSEESDLPNTSTFDTKADKDKVFSAQALSVDGQSLRPVKGYYWDWEFKVLNNSVATGESLPGLPANQYFVSANKGVTDGETKVRAEIKMDRFIPGGSCNADLNCSCSGENCPESCCNSSVLSDGFNGSADLFVFICNNPWPAISASGYWQPWQDSANNCDLSDPGSTCSDFNYKFYYCRDSGSSETSDDLPAILNKPLVSGQAQSLVCSSDRSITCSSPGDRCGEDGNYDGKLDGVCIWGVLKESYFFREDLPSAAEIVYATDLKTSGAVQIEWQSGLNKIDSYKLSYLKSGEKEFVVNEYRPENVCERQGQLYRCRVIVNGLENNVAYIFKASVLSSGMAEIKAANERVVIPTDRVAPAIPSGLSFKVLENKGIKNISFSWKENTDDTYIYRLYRGVESLRYGESFKSDPGNNYLRFLPSQFSSGLNYFSLSAIDDSGNESSKSAEIFIDLSADMF